MWTCKKQQGTDGVYVKMHCPKRASMLLAYQVVEAALASLHSFEQYWINGHCT